MTEGHRVEMVTLATNPKCQGLCKGDRGAADSPARFGHTRDGHRVVWCPCCGDRLRTLDEVYGGKATLGHPPNLRPELTPTGMVRVMDTVCGYDVVVLKEVIAT